MNNITNSTYVEEMVTVVKNDEKAEQISRSVISQFELLASTQIAER